MIETKGVNQRLQYLAGILKEEDNFDLSNNPLDKEYPPQQIDKFVQDASKVLNDSKKLFSSFKSKIENLTIKSIVENSSEAKGLLEKLNEAHQIIKRKHSYYFDIVDELDVSMFDSPENEKKLDRLVSDLDYLEMDFGNLQTALGDLISAAKQFSHLSKDTES